MMTTYLLDKILMKVCEIFESTIVTYPFPKMSLKVLQEGGMPKPAEIKFKTSRSGDYAGYIELTKEDLINLPNLYFAEEKHSTFLLKDKHNNYITSDLDIFDIVYKGRNQESIYVDPVYCFTTQQEKKILEMINEIVKEYGLKKIITHGSTKCFVKINPLEIKWPLFLYTSHTKKILNNWKELSFHMVS